MNWMKLTFRFAGQLLQSSHNGFNGHHRSITGDVPRPQFKNPVGHVPRQGRGSGSPLRHHRFAGMVKMGEKFACRGWPRLAKASIMSEMRMAQN